MAKVRIGTTDRLFLAVESGETPQHVACLAIFRIPAGAGEDFVSKLFARMRAVTTIAAPWNYTVPNVRLKAVTSAWEQVEDERIDLDYHFRHSALPRPGGEREVGVLISRLHSQPLDPSRPLWEFHLVEGLADDRFAIYFKVHHALMDGLGGIERIGRMITPDPADSGIRPLWSIGPRTREAACERGPLERVRGVVGAVESIAATAVGLAKAGGEMVVDAQLRPRSELAVPYVAPKAVVNGRIGRHRRVATQSVEFTRLRAVSKATGATINDVFLAIVGGALRRYLDEFGALPEEGLTAGTPVSVRLPGDTETGNAVTMTVMRLATDVEDPLERLRMVSASSARAKDKLTNYRKSVVDLYGSTFMGPLVAANLAGLGGVVPPPFNVLVSNVPGPLEQQYLAGAPMEAMYPVGCLYHGIALFIAVYAASGRFSIGFTGS